MFTFSAIAYDFYMSLFVVSLKSNLTFSCTSMKTYAELSDFPNATLNLIGLKIASTVTKEFKMPVVPMFTRVSESC
jgi:hypothetical protein